MTETRAAGGAALAEMIDERTGERVDIRSATVPVMTVVVKHPVAPFIGDRMREELRTLLRLPEHTGITKRNPR